MKERPIIFTGESVRAILAGRKTQTRRIVKPQGSIMQPETMPDGKTTGWRTNVAHQYGADAMCLPPHGAKGDRLWIRENFKSIGYGRQWGIEMHYQADGYDPATQWKERETHQRIIAEAPDRNDKWRPCSFGPWRSSMFMPRWASRITLEIVDVRVERLQAITEADARAEGVVADDISKVGVPAYSARKRFEELWDVINGKRATWDCNPWCWVYEFRRLP